MRREGCRGRGGHPCFMAARSLKRLSPSSVDFPSEMAMVLFTPGLCHGSFLPTLLTASILIFLLFGNSHRLLILTVSPKAQGTASPT